jgi:hypothetical protein
LVAVSSQDYNGGLSTDGGKTWNYINFAQQHWGGFAYGAYALTDKIVIAGESDQWSWQEGSKQRISVTYDGGKTVTLTNYQINGTLSALGAKGDNNIAFIGEWCTTDGAKTFKKMNGCTGVLTIDSASGWLFGVNGTNVVMSKDNGASWIQLTTDINYKISHMAYNPKSRMLYYTRWAGPLMALQLNDDCTAAEGGPQTIFNSKYYACGVAVDQSNPDIMYVSCFTNEDYNVQNVWRTLDGGKTWTGLSRQVGDGRTGPDGVNQATYCAINPVTHELYVVTHCNGMWKIPGPPEQYYK